MTEEELIKFGLGLVEKGRSPRSIVAALSHKTEDKNLINKVLEVVFAAEEKPIKKNPKKVADLLKLNKIKLNHEYSVMYISRLPILILMVGIAVLFLSNERVNQNQIFGWCTIAQGVITYILLSYVKRRKLIDFLFYAFLIYLGIWLIELLVFGVPNDFLEAYNHVDSSRNARFTTLTQRTQATGARGVGYFLPFIYLMFKVLFASLLFIAYNRYRQYDQLSEQTKEELKTL